MFNIFNYSNNFRFIHFIESLPSVIRHLRTFSDYICNRISFCIKGFLFRFFSLSKYLSFMKIIDGKRWFCWIGNNKIECLQRSSYIEWSHTESTLCRLLFHRKTVFLLFFFLLLQLNLPFYFFVFCTLFTCSVLVVESI